MPLAIDSNVGRVFDSSHVHRDTGRHKAPLLTIDQVASIGDYQFRENKYNVQSILEFNQFKSDSGHGAGLSRRPVKEKVPKYLVQLFIPNNPTFFNGRLKSIESCLIGDAGGDSGELSKPELTLKKLIEKCFNEDTFGIADVYYSTVLQLRELMNPENKRGNLFPWRRANVTAESLKQAQDAGHHPVGRALLLALDSELNESERESQINAIAEIDGKGALELWNEDHIKLLMTFAAGNLNAKDAKGNGKEPNKDGLSDLCTDLLKARARHLKESNQQKAGEFLTAVSEFLDTVAGYKDSGIEQLAPGQSKEAAQDTPSDLKFSCQIYEPGKDKDAKNVPISYNNLVLFMNNNMQRESGTETDDFISWYTSFVLKDLIEPLDENGDINYPATMNNYECFDNAGNDLYLFGYNLEGEFNVRLRNLELNLAGEQDRRKSTSHTNKKYLKEKKECFKDLGERFHQKMFSQIVLSVLLWKKSDSRPTVNELIQRMCGINTDS